MPLPIIASRYHQDLFYNMENAKDALIETRRKGLQEKFTRLFNNYDKIKKIVTTVEQKEFRTTKIFFEEKRRPISESLKNKYFYIAFVGPYSTGKSTFLNALFQRDFLPENDEKATTAFPTYIYTINETEGEKAVMNFYSASEREELKKYYIERVNAEMKIEESIESLISISNEELLERIQGQKEELDKTHEKYNERLVKSLEKLIKYWNDDLEILKVETTIEETKDYVESNERSIIIKSVDIYLHNNIVQSSDIVLVDLPGVDADNPRHQDVTKQFTLDKNKAHAFVVITAPNKIENDTLNEFLRELGKKARQLEKAFWVVNRCDDSNNPENAKSALQDKISGNKIEILSDRLYATSAKLYKQWKSGTKIEEWQMPIVESIDQLRENLTDYLAKRVFMEYYESIERDYLNLSNRLLDFLLPKSTIYSNFSEEDLNEIAMLEAVDEKLNSWFEYQKTNLREIVSEIRKELSRFKFFNTKRIEKIKSKIEKQISSISNDDLMANTSQLKDINSIEKDEIVRYIKKHIPMNLYIRAEFYKALESEEGYLNNIMLRPKQLLNKDRSNIENPVFADIDSILKNDNLRFRLEGLCDAFLKNYVKLTTEIIQGVIDDNEGLNRLKAIIVLGNKDLLEQNLTYTNIVGQKSSTVSYTAEKPLMKFIIEFPTKEQINFIFTLVKSTTNQEPLYDKSKILSEREQLEYIKIYCKYAYFHFLDRVTKDTNRLIRISLINHFKDMRDRLLKLLDNSSVRKQMLLIFRTKIKEDKNLLDESKRRDIIMSEVVKELKQDLEHQKAI